MNVRLPTPIAIAISMAIPIPTRKGLNKPPRFAGQAKAILN